MSLLDRFDEIKWLLLACVIVFFLLPAVAVILPQYGHLIQIISQSANLLVVDVTSFLCGYNQFRWYYPLLVVLLFAFPAAVGNFYTVDAVATLGLYYLILSFLAEGVGVIIAKVRGNR